MANMGNKYYQIPVDGVDSQRRWSKAGIAFIGGSCLALLSIAAFNATGQRTSAAESTSLLGLSPSLRSSPVGVVKPGIVNSMSPSMMPGSSPFKEIAISAIRANNLGNRVRDVSLMAELKEAQANLKSELSNLDGEAKAVVEKVEKTVAEKARDMAGVTGPFGFFDPLGFSADCSEGKLLFYREVEIKHGRLGMLASLGILVGEQFHPLFGGNIDVPSYVAFQQTPLQTFWPAVVIAIAIPEVFSVSTFEDPSRDDFWTIRKTHQPGDFGFDPLGLKPKDPKELKEMQSKELNNGRLAMIAAAGMIAQEVATGSKLF